MEFKAYTLENLLGSLNEFERKNAPETIFAAGDVSILHLPVVSIVGSRKTSEEGLKRTSFLTKKLTERGIAILSGLAEGIDAMAHSTAIRIGGKTIGVLGTPLDQFYPKSNQPLQEKMMSSHLVLSQFPSGRVITKKNFPMRNRLMALLSGATVIVEANEKSGSLHQAWEALRLNRPLYFLKSNLDRSDLTWPSELLSYGAKILTEDSIDELSADVPSLVELSNFELSL